MPTAAAAADLLRYTMGMAQRAGRYALPKVATVHKVSEIRVDRGWKTSPNNPAAAMSDGTAECHRLSRCLSECHPLINMAKKSAAYGNATSIPTFTSENPDWRFIIVGNQKRKL